MGKNQSGKSNRNSDQFMVQSEHICHSSGVWFAQGGQATGSTTPRSTCSSESRPLMMKTTTSSSLRGRVGASTPTLWFRRSERQAESRTKCTSSLRGCVPEAGKSRFLEGNITHVQSASLIVSYTSLVKADDCPRRLTLVMKPAGNWSHFNSPLVITSSL